MTPLMEDIDVCPVRRFINHFDDGGDSWHLSKVKNAPELKTDLIKACKNVERHLGKASLSDHLKSLLFMECLRLCPQTGDIKAGYETKWSVLLDILVVLPDRPDRQKEYLQFLR